MAASVRSSELMQPPVGMGVDRTVSGNFGLSESGKASPTKAGLEVQEAESRESFIDALGISTKRLSVGYYRLSSERQYVRYVYVPRSLLESSNFSLDEVFSALDIDTPNLIFEINNCDEIENWNMKLPPYKQSLVGKDHPNPAANIYNGSLKHYQGVVEENCKRLIKGTVTACTQASAVRILFR